MIIIICGYNKRGIYNIIVSISAGSTEEPRMKKRKSMVELMQIVKCSLRIVWTSPSACTVLVTMYVYNNCIFLIYRHLVTC